MLVTVWAEGIKTLTSITWNNLPTIWFLKGIKEYMAWANNYLEYHMYTCIHCAPLCERPELVDCIHDTRLHLYHMVILYLCEKRKKIWNFFWWNLTLLNVCTYINSYWVESSSWGLSLSVWTLLEYDWYERQRHVSIPVLSASLNVTTHW